MVNVEDTDTAEGFELPGRTCPGRSSRCGSCRNRLTSSPARDASSATTDTATPANAEACRSAATVPHDLARRAGPATFGSSPAHHRPPVSPVANQPPDRYPRHPIGSRVMDGTRSLAADRAAGSAWSRIDRGLALCSCRYRTCSHRCYLADCRHSTCAWRRPTTTEGDTEVPA